MLIEATCLAFQKMRVPGRYIYDTSKGEKTLEDYNKEKMVEYERRLDRFQQRGLTFPEDQKKFYLSWHKKNLFCRKGAVEKFRRWEIDNEFIHKEKR